MSDNPYAKPNRIIDRLLWPSLALAWEAGHSEGSKRVAELEAVVTPKGLPAALALAIEAAKLGFRVEELVPMNHVYRITQSFGGDVHSMIKLRDFIFDTYRGGK